jgi:hypothetical protein
MGGGGPVGGEGIVSATVSEDLGVKGIEVGGEVALVECSAIRSE